MRAESSCIVSGWLAAPLSLPCNTAHRLGLAPAMIFAELGISVDPHGVVEQRVPCPHCSKRESDKTLGANIGTGAYHCFRCDWAGRAFDEDSNESQPSRVVTRIDDPAVAERKRERLRRTWRETVPLKHVKATPVRNYLESRALTNILGNPPAPLQAHPSLPYWDNGQMLGTYPAMVALFNRADGTPCTLHVTWLRHDGCAKAPVPSPKKILGVPVKGATKGGAIQLYAPENGVLGVAEGIESALSLRLLKKIPVWASFCADNLKYIHLPKNLRELYIGVDIDASGKGEQVAHALAARVTKWSHRTRVCFITPELEGPGDLNDELRRRAN